LLKNFDNALPLQAPKNIGVFGNDAGDLVNGLYPQSDYEFGVLAMGGGSGTGRLSYVVTPLDAIKRRAEQDNALVQYVLNNTMIVTSGTLCVSLPADRLSHTDKEAEILFIPRPRSVLCS
jgi:beta-glucosidase